MKTVQKIIVVLAMGTLFWVIMLKQQLMRFQQTSDYQRLAPEEKVRLSKLVFVKTHKTGSSTLLNILQRYSEHRNKTVVLPNSGHAFGGHVVPMNLGMAYRTNQTLCKQQPCHPPEMMWNHMVFNKTSVELLLPKASPQLNEMGDQAKAIYVTILRNPISAFVSRINFYEVAKLLGYQNGSHFERAKKVLTNYQASWDRVIGKKVRPHRVDDLSLVNWYAYQLAQAWHLPDLKNPSDEAIEMWINSIDQQFHLVMITEYFEESLILLKEIFDIETEELVYFKTNFRDKDKDGSSKISEEQKRNFEEMIQYHLAADVRIYQYFKTKMERMIDVYGHEKMAKEINELRKAIEATGKSCQFKKTNLAPKFGIELHSFKPLNNSKYCTEITMSDFGFTVHHRKKQCLNPICLPSDGKLEKLYTQTT